MRLYWLSIITALAVAFVTCGSNRPPTAGTPSNFASVCDKANEGKRFALEGYLRLPEKVGAKDSSYVLRLFERADFRGDPVGVQVSTGTQPNQIEPVGRGYMDSDLKAHLADGQLAGPQTKVRVSGKVYFPVFGGLDFQCALENPLIEAAK